ncbi:AAA family ATPase [Arthrobacter sp. zg-ZUI227]|nr:AAA family ATPase [Arthrobacter jiangjiafuii]
MDKHMWGDTKGRNLLVARTDSLAELGAALQAGAGAVVVGPAGIGKTALVRAAAAAAHFHVVNIRGSQMSGQTPFGALAWLISELPAGVSERPVQLLPQLEALLIKQAAGLPVLLLLDNAEHLDGSTTMAVSQLVRRSAVKVLATVENLGAAAPDFLALWRDGLLRRIDLIPFTLAETGALMESLLGGRVSSTAALAMQSHSAGNPHLIRLNTPVQANCKSLVQKGGVWVLAKPLVYSAQVGEVMAARLKRLAPPERSLVELLALAGGLPLPALVQLVGSEAVEALEEMRVVEVTETGTARLADFTSAPAIAGSVPPGRSRELWEALSGIMDPEQLDAPALAGFAGWTLACYGTLAPATALRAAALANAGDDPASALSYIRSVPAARRSPGMVLEEVGALMASGSNLEALKVVERFEASNAAVADTHTRGALMLGKAELLRLVPTQGDPDVALREAAAVLGTGKDTAEQRTTVLLTRAALAINTGRLQEIPAELEHIPTRKGLPAALRIQAASLRAQFLALTGRANEALALMKPMGWDTGRTLPPGARYRVYTRTVMGLISAGELRLAGEQVEALSEWGTRKAFRGSSGEVAAGLVHALAGRADKAMRALTSSINQLQVQDPTDVLPVAQTLAAYACSLQEDHTAAKQYLADAAEFAYPPTAQAKLLTAMLRLQAELAQDPEALGAQLRAMASNCLDSGMVAAGLDCLTAAARAGDLEAARELAAAAEPLDGTWTRAQFCFGAGLAGSDPELLLESAQLSLELQNHLHCHAAASAAQRLLRGRRDQLGRAQGRSARRLEHLSFRELRDANSIKARLETLSPFEADLARRAAGTATREEISRALNLSPRTIDWHLGKIFDKLRVSGRPELVEVLG